MMLDFSQWNQINEANIFSKIGKWFETTFGKSYNKLKSLLDDYRDLEMKFVDEWEEVHVEIDKLELKRDQAKSDPAEQKTIQRYITRNRDLLSSMEKSHQKNIDYLMKKVRGVIDEEQKLRNFWEVNKAKVDSEIAEEMYRRSKNLADSRYSESLYRKYKDAVLDAKRRDSEFREKYGELSKFQIPLDLPGDATRLTGIQEPTLDLYSTMSLSDFTRLVQTMNLKEVKNLVSSLLKQRNDLYVKLEIEREKINKQVESKEISREEAGKKMKSVREMYMDKIRDLRSKITVARQHG